jgi:hypothetical protein
MSNEKVQVGGAGVGFFGLLAPLFIGLKLGGIINWSWWLVLLPLYGPLLLLLGIIGVAFAFYALILGFAAVSAAIVFNGKRKK